jgi:predicted RNase H-like HicB family nuclease
MEYSVIVENSNGVWRAVIPALSDLSAEGASEEEAVDRAIQVAEKYLASVKIKTITVNLPDEVELRPDSPQAWLRDAGAFVGDEAAMAEHLEEIYTERQKQCEAAKLEETLTETDKPAA